MRTVAFLLIFIFQMQLTFGQEMVCPKKVIDTVGTFEFEGEKGRLQIPVDNYISLDTANVHPMFSCGLGQSGKKLLIICKPKTNVCSVSKGKVTAIAQVGNTSVIIVRHGEYLSVYANLDTVYVKENQIVSGREKLGQIMTIDNETILEFQLWKNQNEIIAKNWFSEMANRTEK
jgi:murein DD-endopeptidase MepM/ murein hydrolase activator NlpD